MDDKLKRIAAVLAHLSEEQRLLLILELLPGTHAVISKNCMPDIAAAFRQTASRLHTALKSDLKFDPRAIPPVWMAMLETAAVKPAPFR